MAEQPNLDRLRAQLNASGIKEKEPALYQVIDQLIRFVRQSRDSTLQSIGIHPGTGGGTPVITDSDFLTHNNETTTLPNSRRLMAGSNITFDDTVAGQRTISLTAGAGGAEWSVLTDGDLTQPELIFAGGDVIMVHIP